MLLIVLACGVRYRVRAVSGERIAGASVLLRQMMGFVRDVGGDLLAKDRLGTKQKVIHVI